MLRIGPFVVLRFKDVARMAMNQMAAERLARDYDEQVREWKKRTVRQEDVLVSVPGRDYGFTASVPREAK